MRKLLAIAVLAGYAATSAAQLRSIPQDAQRGTLTHVQEMIVELGGSRQRLAPGAQIRDASNRVLLPAAVPAGSLVRYRLDTQGMVRQVWILTPEEAAQPDKK
jgi:hypothetical protein